MFTPERWAAAYLKVAGTGENYENLDAGLALIRAVASCFLRIKVDVSGSVCAAKFNGFVRYSLNKAGYAEKNRGIETACDLIFLLIKKGYLKKINKLANEIEKEIYIKKNILNVSLDTAKEADGVFLNALETKLKKQTGAAAIRFSIKINPELIGGYRIVCGSERQDYSLSRELKQLEAYLS
ncbi:hypothetical protein AGMMS50212_05020 [Spirochaetia bacterium]|nr:hypothetical protein AGMMS50212_05020 [Spirochaetia bacterium]